MKKLTGDAKHYYELYVKSNCRAKTAEAKNIQLSKELEEKEQKLLKAESELATKDDWINRLLSYTEMTNEELQKLMQDTKNSAELKDSISGFVRLISKVMPY